MRIGLYGGTFDPIHNAHLLIAQFIKEELKLSKVIFIPSGIPPHKGVFLSPSLRLKMVQLAIADNPDFEISTFEIDKPSVSYSVDTIARLNSELKLPKTDLVWIVGSDNFVEFEKWKDPTRILEICTVVVFPRKVDDFKKTPEQFANKAVYLDHAPIIEISSTQIRSRLKENLSIKYFVPKVVEDIIYSESPTFNPNKT